MKLKIDELHLPNDNSIDEVHLPNDNSIDELRTKDSIGFDELKVKKKKKKKKEESYEEHFDAMEISKEQKAKRVALAKDLEDVFDYLFYCMNLFAEDSDIESKEQSYYEFFPDGRKQEILVETFDEKRGVPQEDRQTIIDLVEPKFQDAIDKRMEVDSSDILYIDKTLNHLMDSTKDLSNDRAKRDAKNEANSIYNNKELQSAIDHGYTMKTWHTMKDERVRETHDLQDNVTIPIHDYFANGCMFPHDPDASPEEIINCRCSLTFS